MIYQTIAALGKKNHLKTRIVINPHCMTELLRRTGDGVAPEATKSFIKKNCLMNFSTKKICCLTGNIPHHNNVFVKTKSKRNCKIVFAWEEGISVCFVSGTISQLKIGFLCFFPTWDEGLI